MALSQDHSRSASWSSFSRPPPQDYLPLYLQEVSFHFVLARCNHLWCFYLDLPHLSFSDQLPLLNSGGFTCPIYLVQLPKMDDMSTATIEKKATATFSAKPHGPKTDSSIGAHCTEGRRENKGTTATTHKKSEDESSVPPKQPPNLALLFFSEYMLRMMFMKLS
ncbi:WW domain-binding protein 11-like [Tupaia chinensis]|nr:WW domain-binding protein 11-like [Tupaia chinensis]